MMIGIRVHSNDWHPWRALTRPTLLIVLVCLVFVAWIDRPLAFALSAWSDTAIVGLFRDITNAGHSGLWYGIAVIGLTFSYWRSRVQSESTPAMEWQRRGRSFLFVIVSMAASALVVNGLKIALGRYRPRFLFADGTYDFAPFALNIKHVGFPSGHTQSIVAAMVAFGFLWPRWRYVMWTFAALVAASRFVTTTHFASDVIAGAFIAITTAWVLKRYFERNDKLLAWPSPSRLGDKP
jgi:membrane-associated phospholipid phosphatase